MTEDLLRAFGWNRFFQRGLAALGRPELEPGRVVEIQRGRLQLQTGGGSISARLAGRRHHEASAPTDLAVVGDWVAYEPTGVDGPVVVQEVIERRNHLSRKAAGAQAVEQLVAANVDLVLLVMGLDGDYNLRRLERFQAMVEECGARAAVVLNKADLASDVGARVDEVRGRSAGSPVVAVCALEGSLEALELLLEPRETVAFLGSSGAGKSTLINRLLGEEVLPTKPVRAGDSRGRHTTTHRELFRLPGGCLVIDNPGVREIQLWRPDEALPKVFGEIEDLARGCRFADCGHTTEPGCAVLEAIERGELDADRLESLHRLEREAEALERRRDVRAQRESDRKLHKLYRAVQREKRDRRR